MVFSKIAEFISSTTNRASVRQSSSSIPYMSSGLLPPTSYGHGFGDSNSGQKNNLRLSSSLQDLSVYRRLDPENGDLNYGNGIDHGNQPHPLLRENASVSFSKEKMSQGNPYSRKKWARMLMFFLCLLLLGFLVLVLLKLYDSYWSGGASKFYVVLDCGSTGTRVYIYEASINHKKNDNLPIAMTSYSEGLRKKPKGQSGRAYDRMETEPGLDKLVHNISGLKTAIRPLLKWAEKKIPKSSHKTTSLFLHATAGVRRLPSPDSQWLLSHAWSILKHSPFICKREWVKIISGMEEAYYGWIALNYQTGMLGAVPKKATFGALDLGGSSLQVTFETNKPMNKDTNLNLSIGPVSHHLSAYSLSGYGLNDAFDKSVVHILKRMPYIRNADFVGGNVEIKHPCLQTGYKQQYFCSQCASIYEESGSPLQGVKSLGKGGKPGSPVWLVGTPNWAECSAVAKSAVNLSEWSYSNSGLDCDLQPCALSSDLPHPFGNFYAISGFFVVYRFFNLTSEETLDDVLEKGHEFCDKPWNIAYKSVPPQPFIEQYCFRAPYVVSLLREGLHITDNQVTIGSGSTSWTLGVALVEAGRAFSARAEMQSYELFQMKINPLLLFAILFLSSVLLVCAFSCIGNRLPRFFRRTHLPLFRHNSASATSALNIPSPFCLQRWSPISSGDGRKMPLSPTAVDEQVRTFGGGNWFGESSIPLSGSSMPSNNSVSHSSSSGSLGQMQFDNGGMGSFWSPHRGQMRLQSRRSQSREDLSSSLAEVKV